MQQDNRMCEGSYRKDTKGAKIFLFPFALSLAQDAGAV